MDSIAQDQPQPRVANAVNHELKGGEISLNWGARSISEWRQYLRIASRSNWLQTITLAKVLNDRLGKHTKMMSLELDGTVVGIASLQEVKIGPFLVVEMFRGPLWIKFEPGEEHLLQFARALSKAYPKSLLTRRRWIFEWPQSKELKQKLKFLGIRCKKRREFATIWMDITPSVELLYKSLDRRWRNHLNRGIKLNVDVRIDPVAQSAHSFASYHQEDQERRGYKGRSGHFLRDELNAANFFKECILLYAVIDDDPVAGVAIVIHGNSATYRASWNLEKGRAVRAHNILLWEAIKCLKQRGIVWFDLGGISGRNTAGLAHFKRGLCENEFHTLGVMG